MVAPVFVSGSFSLHVGDYLDLMVSSTVMKGKRKRREVTRTEVRPVSVISGDASGIVVCLLDTCEQVKLTPEEVASNLIDINLGNEKVVIRQLATLYDTGVLVSGSPEGRDLLVHQFCMKLRAFGWDAGKVERFKSAAVSKSKCWNAYDGGGKQGLTVRNRGR